LSGAQTLPNTIINAASTQITINIEGQTTITFAAMDNAGNSETPKTLVVKLDKTAPTLNAASTYTVNEGSVITLTATAADAGSGLATTVWDLNNDNTFETNGQSALFTNTINGPAAKAVQVRATDLAGNTTTKAATVNVLNVAPTVGAIVAPLGSILIGTPVTLTANFTDAGKQDTHTASWNWGDGQSTAGSVTEANGSGATQASHLYTQTGVYEVVLSVTDNDGATGQATLQYNVICDAIEGTFATGGGWFNSPAGAYTTQPTVTGKANFGFFVKLTKGSTKPTGVTKLHLNNVNFKFASTSHDSLSINGAKATYKGTGTVNGSGAYGFLVVVTDGQPDKIRIKIWNKANNQVVYDNQPGASDGANPTTALGGGSIVVHK
jgi:hypothetical protein